jgi:hypothetical protein
VSLRPRGSLTVREPVTRESLRALMRELARVAPRRVSGRVFIVGGGTAVWLGWRASTIDVDLHGEPDRLFTHIQDVKERLRVNIEFARPEDFVPPLAGSEARHMFIEKMGSISFYHHDPYAQTLSKVVRGFGSDLEDARSFVASGLVDPNRLQELVHAIPASAYARYPALSSDAVMEAVDAFVHAVSRGPGSG